MKAAVMREPGASEVLRIEEGSMSHSIVVLT